MTNSVLLKQKIEERGLKLGFIVKKLGTSYGWLNKKLANKIPFKVCEIQILCEILDITDLEEKERIFFANNVEENSTKVKFIQLQEKNF